MHGCNLCYVNVTLRTARPHNPCFVFHMLRYPVIQLAAGVLDLHISYTMLLVLYSSCSVIT